MNDLDKSKEELIIELQELRQKYNSLKAAAIGGSEFDLEAISFAGSFYDITDREKLDEKFKAIEQQSRAWLENSPVCTKIVDLNFNLQFMSSTGVKGLKIDNITPYYGKPYPFHFYPESFKTKMTGNMIKAKETGEVITQEAPVVDINGNEVWYHSTIVPVKNDSGKTEYLIIVSLDTTERKLAEKELRESEEKYRVLFNTFPLGVTISDSSGNIVESNTRAAQLLGITWDELKLRRIDGEQWRILRPDGTPMPSEEYAAVQALKGNRLIENVEMGLVKQDDEIRWLNVTAAPLLLDNYGVAITYNDITGRKTAEQNLIKALELVEKSEMLALDILQTAIDAFWTVDNEGRLIDMNQVACEMLGYSREEMLTLKVSDIDITETAEQTQQHLQKVGGTGKDRFETKHRCKDGKIVDVEVSVTMQPSKNLMLVFVSDISERKQMEEELKNRENLLNKVFDLLPIGLWFADASGKLIRGNPAGVKIWGAEPTVSIEEYGVFKARHHPSGKEIGPDDWALAHTIREGVTIADEQLEIDAFDGQKKIILNYTAPVFDDHGNIQGAIVVNQDVTERIRADEALLKSEYEFRLLAEAMPQIVWITRQDGWNIFFNQQWVTYTGLSLKESYGHGWNKPFHPDDQQRAWDAWQNATTNMATYSLECRLRRFDGEYKWWLVRGVPVLDTDGAVLKWFGTCTDIDDIKCSEAELIRTKDKVEENETYLRSVLQSNNDVIVSRDLDNKVVFFNKAFDDITMELFNQHAYAGMNTLNLLPEEGRIFWENVLRKVKNGETNEEEFRYKTLVKTADYISLHVPVLQGSEVVGTLEVTKDITLFRNREDELKQAKEQAEESEQLKSAFLANMSHEIRTPMNGILGFSELLKTPGLSGEQQQQYIKIIEKSGARMLNIINDIIDISKIEAGQMKVDIRESNINEQIEFIYTFFKPAVEAKGMKIFFRNPLSAKAAIIKTDHEKVYAILTNLVKNAIKYTNEGSIELGYDLVEETLNFPSPRTDNYQSLRFYVKDTGIGIPPDRQDAIFERFIQADISDKMAQQGAGLGLSITKAYVEMMGGKIWVESQPGLGSIFYFTLPYRAEMV